MAALITVYTKPGCVQCVATERYLDKSDINYDTVNLAEDQALIEWITEELHYAQAPVVWVDDGTGQSHWSGYRPGKLAEAVEWAREAGR